MTQKDGNEFEFQCRFQQRVQLSGEKLMEFVGALRFLADKAYPQWSGEQRLEVVRRQFIQGLSSSSMQLKLILSPVEVKTNRIFKYL